jgi:hypothetical protein
MRAPYDAAEIPVAWHVRGSKRSVTRNRMMVPPTIRRSFRRLPPDPATLINAPVRSIQRVTPAVADEWIDCCRAALVARCREVAPTMYSNPEEVYLCDLGEGCTLCVIGAHPRDRLALEANYGYVIFSNGIPVGYGGVTPLADQANTGANLFDEFRGSEAAVLFTETLRAFRSLFGISRFVVNPYQFGQENSEALASGALWFYDRIGFRAVSPGTRVAVRRERHRLRDHPGARSSQRTLTRLATSDLVLELDTGPEEVSLFNEAHLVTIGRHVASSISSVDAGQRCEYVLDLARQQKRLLTRSARPLTAVERRGAILLTPIIALIRDALPRWTPRERSLLWALVRAKGAQRERRFVQLSRAHGAFWRALSVACARHS